MVQQYLISSLLIFRYFGFENDFLKITQIIKYLLRQISKKKRSSTSTLISNITTISTILRIGRIVPQITLLENLIESYYNEGYQLKGNRRIVRNQLCLF